MSQVELILKAFKQDVLTLDETISKLKMASKVEKVVYKKRITRKHLTINQKNKIKELLFDNPELPQCVIAKMFKVSQGTISTIKKENNVNFEK